MASPNHSSTSLSDDDDDYNDIPIEPKAVARWSISRPYLFGDDASRNSRSYMNVSPANRLPPEILIHAMRQLTAPRDLHSCLLVSRTWCECSVELLWHKPTFTKLPALFKMITSVGREEGSGGATFAYASFVKRLNFVALASELSDPLFSRLAVCTRLERLTLVNCSSLSDDALSRVLPSCPHLVALDLTNVFETTDASIELLAMTARKLQGINLGGCKKVTDVGVMALARNCPLLRRIKLSNVAEITDASASLLASRCPLLLEIDLNCCPKITERSVRDLWRLSTHMRELRLSQCTELHDDAFPAHPSAIDLYPLTPDTLPPLRLLNAFDHLRMLDLTSLHVTDAAVEGIINAAPKIRNLVLAKCTELTDKSVEAICRLGKHLHYLHLGHASAITDRSVRLLALSCTRLRYIDLACCTLLTDLSVFELANLAKLRRIGLVRVTNLTDDGVIALVQRQNTLERIHLSYCENVTLRAVQLLLSKLHRLTHLSLTGIPAFRKSELQRFCRSPPREFNTAQRQAFCVYSGQGIANLRRYLEDLMIVHRTEVVTYAPNYRQPPNGGSGGMNSMNGLHGMNRLNGYPVLNDFGTDTDDEEEERTVVGGSRLNGHGHSRVQQAQLPGLTALGIAPPPPNGGIVSPVPGPSNAKAVAGSNPTGLGINTAGADSSRSSVNTTPSPETEDPHDSDLLEPGPSNAVNGRRKGKTRSPNGEASTSQTAGSSGAPAAHTYSHTAVDATPKSRQVPVSSFDEPVFTRRPRSREERLDDSEEVDGNSRGPTTPSGAKRRTLRSALSDASAMLFGSRGSSASGSGGGG